MSKNIIKAVVFDLDNTLYNEARYFESIIEIFLSEIGRHGTDITNLVDIKERIEATDYLGNLLKKLSLYSSDMQNRLFNLYCNSDVIINLEPSVISVLKKLKSMSLKLGILTNGVVAAQKNKVKCLSLSQYFDHICYARDLGKLFEKPHSLAFSYICQKLYCEPQNVLFVGDHPVNDVQGAKDAGMMTCWMINQFFLNPVQANFSISNLDELITTVFYEE